jgi:hypothetical protein
VEARELRLALARLRPDAAVGEWRAEPIGHEIRNSATAGLWRVRAEEWSIVLKLVHHSRAGHENWLSSEDPAHWNYWRREPLAYSSGLLDSLRGGLRPPRSAPVERADGSVALWLEDLSAPATRWPLERYGPAARHLGRAQGEFLAGRPLPDEPWLSRGWLRAYMAQRGQDMHLLENANAWSHPLVRVAFPEPRAAETRRLWEERERFLAALDRLPRTLCHLDLWPRNLFADDAPGEEPRTVAVDWSFVGIGAVGEDAGNLVPDAMLDLFVDSRAHARELCELVYAEYLRGLADAGFAGDARLVRLGFAASAALKYAWIPPWLLRFAGDEEALAANEAHLGAPREEMYARRGATMELLFELADEARALARELGL